MPENPLIVKGSWFGNSPGWVDESDSGLQASGLPVAGNPGIALPSHATLGHWFDVTAPNGQTYRLQQTDVGPAKWTGRGVDINSPAAQLMGYSPKNFPTDAEFKVQYAAGGAVPHALAMQGSAPGTEGMNFGPMATPLQIDSGLTPTPPVLPHDSLPQGYGAGNMLSILAALGAFGSTATHRFQPVDYDPWRVAHSYTTSIGSQS